MPIFGRETIRRFVDNISEMKRMAGYHHKDNLQVQIVDGGLLMLTDIAYPVDGDAMLRRPVGE
jgi:hypothetical protein